MADDIVEESAVHVTLPDGTVAIGIVVSVEDGQAQVADAVGEPMGVFLLEELSLI
jgi:hypothetical protein